MSADMKVPGSGIVGTEEETVEIVFRQELPFLVFPLHNFRN